jgi:hypothetical protein
VMSRTRIAQLRKMARVEDGKVSIQRGDELYSWQMPRRHPGFGPFDALATV